MKTTRRDFLRTTLLGLAAAPLVAKGLVQVPTPRVPQLVEFTYPSDPEIIKQLTERKYRVEGVAIKVPANRFVAEDVAEIMENGYHPETAYVVRYFGDWDGKTFKLERGCSSPAYIYADLVEQAGGEVNWQEIYKWGRYCDEPADGVNLNLAGIREDGSVIKVGSRMDPKHPRFTVNTVLQTEAETASLMDELKRCKNSFLKTLSQ